MGKQSKSKARKAADDLLTEYGLRTAPVPVEKIAKHLGAQVRFSPLDDELSGMIFIKDNIPIIGVNALHHPNRQRFTIAHEIGHLQLHRDQLGTAMHVDKKFPILMRGTTASLGTDEIEMQANEFAAALLIPEFLLNQLSIAELSDIDDETPLEELAKRFRVSKQTVEYRIRNL